MDKYKYRWSLACHAEDELLDKLLEATYNKGLCSCIKPPTIVLGLKSFIGPRDENCIFHGNGGKSFSFSNTIENIKKYNLEDLE